MFLSSFVHDQMRPWVHSWVRPVPATHVTGNRDNATITPYQRSWLAGTQGPAVARVVETYVDMEVSG
jgi:hypothetical protein